MTQPLAQPAVAKAIAPSPSPPTPKGRPRSDQVHRKILDAARELLSDGGFSDLRLEHVAARAGVGKATIYRRWGSKEALAQELLAELAAPHIAVAESDDTRTELLAAVVNPMRAVTDTPFGPVIRALLSQIAVNPTLGDPFRATVVQARRNEIARVIARGIARGDLHPDADPEIATELLVGPVYFRLMFGGALTMAFANRIVDSVLRGYGAGGRETGRANASTGSAKASKDAAGVERRRKGVGPRTEGVQTRTEGCGPRTKGLETMMTRHKLAVITHDGRKADPLRNTSNRSRCQAGDCDVEAVSVEVPPTIASRRSASSYRATA